MHVAAAGWETLIPGHGEPMTRPQFEQWRSAFEALVDCGRSSRPVSECADGWVPRCPTLHRRPGTRSEWPRWSIICDKPGSAPRPRNSRKFAGRWSPRRPRSAARSFAAPRHRRRPSPHNAPPRPVAPAFRRRSRGADTRAGTPTIRLPGGKVLPSVTSAPAPTRHSVSITAPLRIFAPIPIRQSSAIVQPWRIAWCPTVTRAPIVSGKPGSHGRSRRPGYCCPRRRGSGCCRRG